MSAALGIFSAGAALANLLNCLAGAALGTFVGVTPGLRSVPTIALPMPRTFALPPDSVLIMPAGIY